jgi:arsenate reductase (thioredoxin)
MVDSTRVLFLCTHNAARSQMAEALLRHYAGSRFEVSSAGLAPTTVHAFTRKVLEEIDIDARALQAKSLSAFLGKVRFHYAIIVCQPTEEHCPQLYPFALQTLYWPFDDPVQADASFQGLHKFREVRDQIATQLRNWLNQSALKEDDTFDDTDRLLAWDAEVEEAAERTPSDTKQSIHEQPDLKTRARAKGQFFLGIIQMLGAVVSLLLLVQTGVSTLALSAVVLTCACTTVSVLLFASRRRRGKKEPR